MVIALLEISFSSLETLQRLQKVFAEEQTLFFFDIDPW
jgi:hypothetical protein